ncbi:MAG: EamA family transporter [Steroidobacteraceae bacterium]
MATSQTWLVFAILSAICAGLTAVFAKIGLEGIDSDYALLLRTLLIVCILVPLVAATGKWTNPLSLPHRTLIFLVLSAIATGASWLFYFRALQLGSVSQVAPVDKLSVAFAAVLAVIFLGERPDARGWLGISLVVLGVLVLGVRR